MEPSVGSASQNVVVANGPALRIQDAAARWDAPSGFLEVDYVLCNDDPNVFASSVTVRVVLSQDTTITADDGFVMDHLAGFVAPGTCILRRVVPTLVAVSGIEYVGVVADPLDVIDETSEAGHTRLAGRVVFDLVPNLIVRDTHRSNRSAGTPSLSYTICNDGNARAGGSGFIGGTSFVYWSPTPDPMAGTFWQGDWYPPINPGRCARVASNWIPGTSYFGAQHIIVAADAQFDVAEADEADNYEALPYVVHTGAAWTQDLVVDEVEVPSMFMPDPAQIRARVCNWSLTTSVPTPVGLFLGAGHATGPVADLITVPALSSHECFNLGFEAQPLPGGGQVSVMVDPMVTVPGEATANNLHVGPSYRRYEAALQQPDLVIRGIEVAEGVPVPIPATVEVCNVGSSSAPASEIEVSETLLTDPQNAIGGSLTWGPFRAPTPALQVGQCAALSLLIPALGPHVGPVRLLAHMDPAGLITEMREDNNAAISAPTVVGSGPDFVIEQAFLQAPTGSRIAYLHARICNQGNVAGTPVEIVTLIVNADDVLDAQDSFFAPRPLVSAPSIAPGACWDSVTSLGGIPSGLYSTQTPDLVARVREVPSELSANNNELLIGPYYVRDTPLLRVEAFDAPMAAAPNQSINLTVTLCGAGGPVAPVTISSFLSRDGVIDSDDLTLLPATTILEPAPGVCQSTVIPATLPAGASGQYEVGLRVSNTWADKMQLPRRIVVGSGSNLRARIVNAPTSASGAFSAVVELCNDTDVGVQGSDVSLLASWDTEIRGVVWPQAASDVVVGQVAFGPVAPATCLQQTINGNVTGLAPGTRFLAAYADRGNRIVEVREDDNASVAQAFTVLAGTCGDGIRESGEACDDGNLTSGDGCSSLCASEVGAAACGNAALEAGELCDDGNRLDHDGCNQGCQTEGCGDGAVSFAEQCDDGNLTANDGCSSTCTYEFCGNAQVEVGEQCDDGNLTPNDGCSETCQVQCGDGIVLGTEQCDDGNLVRGDGCDETCRVEVRTRQGEVLYTRGNNQRLTHAIADAAHPLNPTQALTFALWAREPRTPWETPANRWDSTGKVWSFSHNSNGVMGFAINDGSGSRNNYRAFATRPNGANAWTHYAMTYDQGTVHVYRNGVLDDGALSGSIPSSLSGGISDFHLGHGFYNGAMGNVMLVNRALDATEVADVYCALSDDPAQCSCGADQHACSDSDVVNLAGLVSYWPLTSGPQDVIGGHHFVEEGTSWAYNDRTPVVVPVDAGVPDTGIAPDAGFVDTGIAPDAGFVDTGIAPDAGFVDSGVVPDAGMLDSGMLDAGGGPASGVPAGRFPLSCQSVAANQPPISGSDPAASIFDGDLLTGFTPNHLDWLAVRCDFGRLRTVAAVRRAMALTSSGQPNRIAHGEQVSLSPDAVTWTRLTEPTTTGWSGYQPYGAGLYSWQGVAYGWSNWLELNQPMSARYIQYYWDAVGPTEAMLEIEAFFHNECGNRLVEGFEQCDDGNLVRGDGCDEQCTVETRAQLGEVVYTRGNNQRLTHAIVDPAHPLNPSQAFTFSLWAREPRSAWETPANRWDSVGKVWSFSHNSNGVMGIAINDGSGSRANYRPFATSPDGSNSWTHYTMTYDQGALHVYRNGVLDDGPLAGTIPTSLSGGVSDLHLGHGAYNGAMGNVAFFDRALNAQEVSDVFCSLSPSATPCVCGVNGHVCSESDLLYMPGLVSYWPMTSGPQDVVGGYDLVEQGSGWSYGVRP